MRFSSCSVCGTEVINSGNGRNRPRHSRKCIDCIRIANMAKCAQCGRRFHRNRSKQRFCSQSCWYGWRSRNRDDMSTARRGATRRARKREAFVEYVDHTSVFRRDRFTCWICEGPIIPGHPRWGASVDHVVPLALGGLHCYSNVLTAHMVCNHIKGSRYWPPDPLDPLLKPLGREDFYDDCAG